MLSISPVLKLCLILDLFPKSLSLVTVPCKFHLPWSLCVVIAEMLCLGALDCRLTTLKRTPPFQLCIKALLSGPQGPHKISTQSCSLTCSVLHRAPQDALYLCSFLQISLPAFTHSVMWASGFCPCYMSRW